IRSRTRSKRSWPSRQREGCLAAVDTASTSGTGAEDRLHTSSTAATRRTCSGGESTCMISRPTASARPFVHIEKESRSSMLCPFVPPPPPATFKRSLRVLVHGGAHAPRIRKTLTRTFSPPTLAAGRSARGRSRSLRGNGSAFEPGRDQRVVREELADD